MARTSQTYGTELWAQGTRGLVSGAHSDKCIIENMQVYPSGALGPRPWFREHPHLAVTLLGVQDTEFHGIAIVGNRWDGYHKGSTLLLLTSDASQKVQATARPWRDGWTVLAPTPGNFYPYDDNAPAAFSNPRFDVGKTEIDFWNMMIGTQKWSVSSSGVNYTPAASMSVVNFSRFGTNVNPSRSCLHQGRMFYYGTTPYGRNRIYYSDPYAYTNFSSAAQYFDVDGEVESIHSVSSSLIISTIEGNWYVLQGRGNPADGTLFPLGKFKTPHRMDSIAALDSGLLYFSRDRRGIVQVTADELDDNSLRHLAPLRGEGTGYYFNQSVAAGKWNVAVLGFAAGADSPEEAGVQAYTFYDGYWVHEVFFGDGTACSGIAERMHMAIDDEDGVLYLVDSTVISGGLDTVIRVYSRDLFLGRPSRADDRYSDYIEARKYPTDGVIEGFSNGGRITLPRMPADVAQTVRVRNVTVDGRYWASSVPGSEFAVVDLVCQVTDGRGTTSILTTDTNFSTVAATDLEVGKPIRVTFSGELPHTSWSEVHLTDITSFAIDRVIVEYEWEESGPWM